MRITYSATGKKLRGANASEQPSFTISETPLGQADTVTEVYQRDLWFQLNKSAGFINNFKLNVSLAKNSANGIYSSSDSNVASVNQQGQVTYVASGTVTITYTAPNFKLKVLRQMVNNQKEVTTYKGFAPNTAGKHINDNKER